MARVGLYFGSFNPIHTGHLIVAEHMIEFGPFDEIWFVVSPHNPFKQETDLWPQQLRIDMVRAAISDEPRFRASDVEFSLPTPSYTRQTLAHLLATTEHSFGIIMGADNLHRLSEWKDIDYICSHCDFHIYGRRGSEMTNPLPAARMHFYQAPLIDISATRIRELHSMGKSLKYLLPEAVIRLLPG